MNWKQAMQAMVEGHKVRGWDYIPDTWISAEDGTNSMFFSYAELQAMNWEIYEEQTTNHDEIIKIFNASTNKAQQAMRDIFKEALEDIEKLKIR